MKGVQAVFSHLFQWVFKVKVFIPRGMAGLFILYTLFSDIYHLGYKEGFIATATTLLSAEMAIREAVDLAIQNSIEYGLGDVFVILSSIFLLYYFVRIISEHVLIGLTGSQARSMAYILGVVAVGLIEMSVVGYTQKVFFIPIWDGLLYLLFNLSVVIQNIYIFSWQPFAKIMIDKASDLVNSTIDSVAQNVSITNNETTLSQMATDLNINQSSP